MPLIAAVLAVPSTGVVHKYLGYAGLLAYLTGVFVVVQFALPWVLDRLHLISERFAIGALLVVGGVVAVAFAVVHPAIDLTKGDANEALNYAGAEIVNGRYPYYVTTQSGNTLSPLPGAIFIALPFSRLGDSAYQQALWLPVYCLLCRHLLGSWRMALLVVVGILALSPAVIQTILIGNDHLVNPTYLIAFSVLVLLAARRRKPLWMLLGAAVLLGIGLSSRGNFVFLLLPLGAALLVSHGARPALTAVATAGFAFLAVTLPFYLHDPDGFTPLDATDKIAPVFPYAAQAMVLGAGLLALYLAARTLAARDGSIRRLLRDMAIVQAYQFLAVGALFGVWIEDVPAVLRYVKESYGVFFMLPGLLALLMAREQLVSPACAPSSPAVRASSART